MFKLLFDFIYEAMQTRPDIDAEQIMESLQHDYALSKMKGMPKFMRDQQQKQISQRKNIRHQQRQLRHLTS